MAVPKRKTSKSKRDMRRAQQKVVAPSISTCPQCGEPALPHHACTECGYYRDRQVLETEED